jgi:hypothetical protein
MSWRGPRDKPYKVVRYSDCPECNTSSVGVQKNGRIVRHSMSFGSVERLSPAQLRRGFINTPVCKGSGFFVGAVGGPK